MCSSLVASKPKGPAGLVVDGSIIAWLMPCRGGSWQLACLACSRSRRQLGRLVGKLQGNGGLVSPGSSG